MSNLTLIDKGVARKHLAKTAGAAAAGGLSDAERTDDNDREPIACEIQSSVNGNAIRVTWDGTTPTATLGFHLDDITGPFYIYGTANVKNLDWIREGGADGTIQIVLYYG